MARKSTQSFFSLSRSEPEPWTSKAKPTPVYLDLDEFEKRTLLCLDIQQLRVNSFFVQVHDIFQLSGIEHLLYKKMPSKMSYDDNILSVGWKLPKDGIAVMKVTRGATWVYPLPADDFIVDDEGFEMGVGIGNLPSNLYELAMTYDDTVFNKTFNVEVHDPRTKAPLLPDWWVAPLKALPTKS